MVELTNKQNRNVLIIDDDEDDCALIAETLKEIDKRLNCVLMTDGKAALSYLNEFKVLPDIIFLDLHMPKMSGIELLKLLKEHKELTQIPVIVCTDSIMAREIDECKMLGAAHVIKKPSSFFLTKYEIRKGLKIIADTLVSQTKMQA